MSLKGWGPLSTETSRLRVRLMEGVWVTRQRMMLQVDYDRVANLDCFLIDVSYMEAFTFERLSEVSRTTPC